MGDEKHLRGKITRRVDISPELWVIRVDPGGEIAFAAGQYATLGVRAANGKIVERAYSIVSSPRERELEFFIELVSGGSLTPLLHTLREGDEILVRKAMKGKFTLDLSAAPNHLLLCTVTGVAPFVSFVRSLRWEWREGRLAQGARLFLIEAASRSLELGYREELESAAAGAPWLTYLPTVSRPWDDPEWRGETGRVEDLVRKYADAWGLTPHNTIGYLCGHPGMIESCRAILNRAGFLERGSLRWEAYWVPSRKPSAGPAPPEAILETIL